MLAGTAMADAPRHEHVTGAVDFPVSCSAAAHAAIQRAVTLLHHMAYPQAREAFEAMVVTDPDCAMAHWGVAMTLFQPLWPTRPGAEARARGWDEVRKARALVPPTRREQLFVAAAEAFFLEPASDDYWLRIRRWAEASGAAYAAFPADDEAAVFAALGILATTPADRISRAHADRGAAILMKVLAHNPDHPGAMHYLVHANDVPGRERESIDITRAYESVAPDNPHALHMPTHIYTRLGDWDGTPIGNALPVEISSEDDRINCDQPALVIESESHETIAIESCRLRLGTNDVVRTAVVRDAFKVGDVGLQWQGRRRALLRAIGVEFQPEHFPVPAIVHEEDRGSGRDVDHA
jgi:hypothetical protein